MGRLNTIVGSLGGLWWWERVGWWVGWWVVSMKSVGKGVPILKNYFHIKKNRVKFQIQKKSYIKNVEHIFKIYIQIP